MSRKGNPQPSDAARVPRARDLMYALLALLFALADTRFVLVLMQRPFQLSSRIAEGVVHGEPYWRVYQSRVLAPYLIDFMRGPSGDFTEAYAVFMFLALFAAGFLVLALTARLNDRTRRPGVAFLIFQITFLFLVPNVWLYPWDLLALPLFTVFNFLVLRGARTVWFAVLYAVAIFNHEIAFFIAGWLVLDPLVRRMGRAAPKPAARFDWARELTGLALLAGGIALVEGLRRALLVHEVMRPDALPGLITYGRDFHFTLLQNVQTIVDSFHLGSRHALPFVVPLFLLPIVVIAILLARSDGQRFGALALVQTGMIASTLLFGLVVETRILLPLVPFVAMNAWPALGEPGGGRRRPVG
jgi:hypothetical protein